MELGEVLSLAGILSIVGGLLHLDRTAALQFLFSRPLVSSVVTGLILGDLKTGLLIGVVLELLWLGAQPLGTALPPDDTIVAVAAPAAAIITGRLLGVTEAPLVGLAVLVSLPLSEAGRLLDAKVRKLNGVFVARAKAAAKQGDIRGIQRQNYAGLVSFFIFFALLTGIGVLAASALTCLLYPRLPAAVMTALTWIFWSLPFFGCGAVLGRQKGLLTFGITYILAFGLMVSLAGGIW
jgi:PTS system N-acetylgalactosamine-specific IIC component